MAQTTLHRNDLITFGKGSYHFSLRRTAVAIVLAVLALSGCQTAPKAAPATPGWQASLDSLERVDDHPLWTMRYEGGYDRTVDGMNAEGLAIGLATPPAARW